MTTVIIPAHNEESVIENTLEALLESTAQADTEVIVVCNGCVDDTADRARRFGSRVRVVETPIGSKIHALNLGDQHARGFPRIYLDADIVVSQTLIPDMEAALAGEAPRAAWPTGRYDTSHSSWTVRAFYYVWTRMPYNRPGRIGVGVYGMNAAARQRFEAFPQIISDDGYIRGLFEDDERIVVDTCHARIAAPTTLWSLIKIRSRSRLGICQLRSTFPRVLGRHRNGSRWEVLQRVMQPGMLACLPVYLLVNLVARLRARFQAARLHAYEWERDTSTREAA